MFWETIIILPEKNRFYYKILTIKIDMAFIVFLSYPIVIGQEKPYLV